MKNIIYLLVHLLTNIAKLIQPGGNRAIIAENLLLKQQLIIHSRPRQRAPNLTTRDRAVLGLLSLFLNHRRLVREYKKYKQGVSTRLSGPSWSVTATQREKLTYCPETVLASVRRQFIFNGMDFSSPYHFGVDAPEW